jgi:RNA polymerase sigma-70 factor, ECF subfamily
MLQIFRLSRGDTDYTLVTPEWTMSTKRQEHTSGLSASPELRNVRPDLASSLYDQLHRLAAAKMRNERANHTLQPTALVNEAYLRLADCDNSLWQDRARVLGTAAHLMRNILVDHARAHRAGKRGAGAVQVTLDSGLVATGGSPIDVLAVDGALTRLASFDPRQASILELHFFTDLTFEEIAVHLGVSARTIKRDWAMARAWLHNQLAPLK